MSQFFASGGAYVVMAFSFSLRKSEQLHVQPIGGPIPASRAAACISIL